MEQIAINKIGFMPLKKLLTERGIDHSKCIDKSDLVEKYIFFGLNPATSGAAYGVALLGWGVGKINAVQSGAKSIKNFAKLNLIPMACWIATNFQNDAPMTENIFPGLFAAAYAYIVWG